MTRVKLYLINVCLTRAAQEEIPEADFKMALKRHVSGDWGELDDHDRQANDAALLDKSRIVSVYRSQAGKRFWIITDAGHETTTILLPDDY